MVSTFIVYFKILLVFINLIFIESFLSPHWYHLDCRCNILPWRIYGTFDTTFRVLVRVNKKEVLCNKAKCEIEIWLEASGECVIWNWLQKMCWKSWTDMFIMLEAEKYAVRSHKRRRTGLESIASMPTCERRYRLLWVGKKIMC